MESIEKNTAKHYLFIIDADYYYALRVKHSLKMKYGEEVLVDIFSSAESSVETMKDISNKPHILLMDHTQNKQMPSENGEYAVDVIKRISPSTRIVILANEEDKESASKALGHGAQSFVLKDQFTLEHIYSAVESCLHPSKV